MRKSQIGSGDRSERIRTYNFPQSRITDHRINLTSHRLEQIIKEGELDEFIEALISRNEAERLTGGVMLLFDGNLKQSIGIRLKRSKVSCS